MRTSSPVRQKGAALIIIVFILAIALTSYILKEMSAENIRLEHQRLVTKNLNIAKEALLAWAVANSDYPGQMPYPDRGTDAGGYDGKSDCSVSNPINNQSLLIGQLPMYGSTGCIGLSVTEGLAAEIDDGNGNRLWYAVSPNLMHNYAPTGAQLSDPVINSDTMNTATWLRIIDNNGNLVSDRVAVVILSPGEALGNQSRSLNATTDQYLDTFQKNGITYSNSNYDAPDEDFIIGTPMDKVSEADVSYGRPYLFNDQLVYITIDELLEALEKRVGRQVVASLNAYYVDSDPNPINRFYPYAAAYQVTGTTACIDNQLFGQLPLTACSTPDLSTYLPAWFTQNKWEDVTFYTLSSDCSSANSGCDTNFGKLTVGTDPNVNALVIATGATLTGQARPTANPLDYLEGANANVGTDLIFEAVGTQLTNTYNDQTFIVAP
ncbi:MAG: hypothetical protein ACMZ63_08410 [Methylotenera sp.]